MANHVADQVRRSRESQLLEPLNPFERRLIHTSLARYGDIETVSEGEGLYKRIRVICRGEREARRSKAMPIFEYECKNCRSAFELLVRSETKIACPSCESERVVKKLSLLPLT